MKNDRTRVRAKCKGGCGWVAYIVKLPNEETWQPRTLVAYKVGLYKSDRLSKRLFTCTKENPKMKMVDVRENVGITGTKSMQTTINQLSTQLMVRINGT